MIWLYCHMQFMSMYGGIVMSEEKRSGNDEIICYCDHVTKGEIIDAMEQGARTLPEIKRMTGACTSCRCAELNPSGKCCAQDIAMVMREYLTAVQ